MTGDLCSNQFCNDLAHPAQEMCVGCIADRQAERELTARQAADRTARFEAELAAVVDQ